MISFQTQFKECSACGFIGYDENEICPEDLPLNKKLAERILKEKIVKYLTCLRFGGRCHSKNESCVLLRKIKKGA